MHQMNNLYHIGYSYYLDYFEVLYYDCLIIYILRKCMENILPFYVEKGGEYL